nr:putative ribonuclease H-like domain-containing protein [Tanacetum cinerariifolium]
NEEVVSSPKDDAGKKLTIEPTCVEGGKIDDLGCLDQQIKSTDDLKTLTVLTDSPLELIAYSDSDYAGASLDRKSTTGGYSPLELIAYSDSDYAGASLDRKSTTGGCQFLCSRLISWKCKKQTIVANFIIEAEYIAVSSYCGQVLWLQNQLLDYGYNFMQTKIHMYNECSICVVKNSVYHSKTKHILIRHHFIRDSYEKWLIEMAKIHTDSNVADLLTKTFDVTRFQFKVASIGLLNPKSMD